MSARGSSRPSLVLGLALGGVLLGHTVAYRLLLPDAHTRTLELAASGHGYLSGANMVGLVAAVSGLATLFLGGVLRTHQAEPRNLAARLVGFQMAAFVAMEVLERLASGGRAQYLAAVLLIGLPVQALIAVLVALVARLLLRAAAVVADLLDRTPAWERVALAFVDGSTAPRTRPRTGRPPGRAPPSLVVVV
jgi:hypothetical protein